MKILIIEDNNEISEMLATILAADYTVQQAYSGTEGLLLFQQDAFDLILLDRMLPGKDGTQVLQEIRQTSTVPVIILTALDEPADVSTLLLAGANDYLTKPFNVEELKARIIVQLRTNKQPLQLPAATRIKTFNCCLTRFSCNEERQRFS